VKRNGAKVETPQTNNATMGYMQDTDRWLDALLADAADGKIGIDELKRAIREKLLESYRNGLKAAGQQSPAPQRDGRPRFRKRA
jgi:hypothetical protein